MSIEGVPNEELREQSQMDYWWPRLKKTDVWVPETAHVSLDWKGRDEELRPVFKFDEDQVQEACEQVDYPAFIRNEHMSAKHHHFHEASVIHSPDEIQTTVRRLIQESTLQSGVITSFEYHHLYIREFLNLHSLFDYKGTPISVEIRTYLYNGKLWDYGWYWEEQALERCGEAGWRDKLNEMKDLATDQHRVSSLKNYANKVAEEFNTGYWSLDFALTEYDQWYAIDMARGELSWHPDDVEPPKGVER